MRAATVVIPYPAPWREQIGSGSTTPWLSRDTPTLQPHAYRPLAVVSTPIIIPSLFTSHTS